MVPLLLALHGPALAGAEDLVLDLQLIEPMGTALIDEQVTLPFSRELDLTLGPEAWRVVVTAELTMEGALADAEVEVVAGIYRLDGAMRSPTRMAAPTLVLPPDTAQTARVLLDPRAPLPGPDGQPMAKLSWALSASWTEARDPAWLSEARARPAAPGEAVLAWADATLYAAPGQAVGRLRALDERALAPGALLAWEVVADKGEWLEVAPLEGRASRKHCVPGDPVLHGLDLRLLLRREDLVLVTHTSAVMDYSDGTGSALAAGVPLLPVPGQTRFGHPLFESMARGLAFSIPLPPAPLALGYTPLGGALHQAEEGRLRPDADGVLGHTAAGPVRALGGATGRGVSLVDPAEDGRVGVSVGDHCASHRLVVEAARLDPPEDEDLVLGGGATAPPAPGFTLPSGLMLYWADGHAAGILTRERGFAREPTPRGDLTCVDLAAEGAAQRGQPVGDSQALVCVQTEALRAASAAP